MNNVPPIFGQLGIPAELEDLLPWWLRYWNSIFITPLSIAAIVAMSQSYSVISAALLVLAMTLSISSFWVAKAWLSRRGYWVRGTWYAEVLPDIHKLRSLFFSTTALGVVGSYLILATNVHSTILVTFTISALVLIIPFFVWLSVVQGFIGSGLGNVDYREVNPARFWVGLLTYVAGMCVFVALTIFFIIKSY